MPTLEGPLMSLGAHGTLGDVLTYQGGRKRFRVIKKPIPTDVGSDDQIRVRSIFFQLCELWNASTVVEKGAWLLYRDMVGNSGKDAWMRVGLRRAAQRVGAWQKESGEPGFPWHGDDAAFVYMCDEGGWTEFLDFGDNGFHVEPDDLVTESRGGFPYYEGATINSDVDKGAWRLGSYGAGLLECTIVADLRVAGFGIWQYVGGYQHTTVDYKPLTLSHNGTTHQYRVQMSVPGVEMALIDNPNDGLWHRIGATYDGVTMLGYLDGAVVDTNPATGNITAEAHHVAFGQSYDSVAGEAMALAGAMDRFIVSGVSRPSLMRRIGV